MNRYLQAILPGLLLLLISFPESHAQTNLLFEPLFTLEGVESIHWASADNRLIVQKTGSNSDEICFWESTSNLCELIATYPSGSLGGIALSPEGQLLAVGRWQAVEVIETATYDMVASLTIPLDRQEVVQAVAWANSENYLAVGLFDTIFLFEKDTWSIARSWTVPPYNSDEQSFTFIDRLVWSFDDRYLASENPAVTVAILTVFDSYSGESVYQTFSRGIQWLPNQEGLAIVQGDAIRIFDATTFQVEYAYAIWNARHMSWTSNEAYLTYFAVEEGTLVTIETATGRTVSVIEGEREYLNIDRTAWSPDSSYFAILAGGRLEIYPATFLLETE